MTGQQQMTQEQVQELQEKLKNMSPEELKEFQKRQCLFCHIIAGKIPAKKVFEDQSCIAILDINPANPGHVLLLPKEHYAIMPQIPEDEVGHLITIAKRLSNSLLRSIEAKGTNILVANGVEAGQKAQHFMIHIIPRYEKDDVNFTLPQKELKEEELDRLSERITTALGQEPKTDRQGKAHPLNIPGKIKEAHAEQHKQHQEEHEAATQARRQAPAQPALPEEPEPLAEEKRAAPKRKSKKKSSKKKTASKEEDSLDDIADLLKGG